MKIMINFINDFKCLMNNYLGKYIKNWHAESFNKIEFKQQTENNNDTHHLHLCHTSHLRHHRTERRDHRGEGLLRNNARNLG